MVWTLEEASQKFIDLIDVAIKEPQLIYKQIWRLWHSAFKSVYLIPSRSKSHRSSQGDRFLKQQCILYKQVTQTILHNFLKICF